jgi:hypothetical protein
MLGLLATDRLVLRIAHRVLMQSAHRATGVLGVAGLGFHVLTKIATGRAAPTDALVPFVGGRGLYVGLGTVAALLMVSVIWTGIIRARFAGVGPKWLWRTLHSTAYLAWPFAIFHGLNAGRAAAPWVMFSYLGCMLLVVLALLFDVGGLADRIDFMAFGITAIAASLSWTILQLVAFRNERVPTYDLGNKD